MQFTFAVTRRRIHIRRALNDSDTDANTKAVDSLLNYETVKYFNAELHEERRFDRAMEKYATASIKTQQSLSYLNAGQAVIISLGLMAVMILAAFGVKNGQFTVGDMVMANALIIQLYVPLNLLGTSCTRRRKLPDSSESFIRNWIETKRRDETDAIATRPHPYEYALDLDA